MSIKFKCVDHTLHIEVAACDRFSCQILLPTPYADDHDSNADQIMAWARKMALQVNQSNSAWGVYHTYSGEEVAWLILNAVAKTEFTDDDNNKTDALAWELKFRTLIVNHHQQEN